MFEIKRRDKMVERALLVGVFTAQERREERSKKGGRRVRRRGRWGVWVWWGGGRNRPTVQPLNIQH